MTHAPINEAFMRQAIAKAKEAGSRPADVLFGCVIVLDGQVIAAERNRVGEDRDVTAHAEMRAIRAAGNLFEKGELRNATLYTTLQPCGMCTMASIWSKVRRIVYGAGRNDVHSMYFEARAVDTLEFVRMAYRDDVSIVGGVLREECVAPYYRPGDEVPLDEQGNL